MGTWYDATYGAQSTATYIDFGGTGEDQFRPPASAAFALATSIATGTYDPALTGVSEADAIAIARRLVVSLAYRHRTNGPGGWGHGWQTPLWAAYAGMAGWLLDSHLTAEERSLMQRMVVSESYWTTNSQPTVFWKNSAGVENYPGDSKAEELSWQSMVLQVACVMLPDHPDHDAWFAKMIEKMKAAWSIEADGLAGWNVNSDGTIVNHNIIHPDYMATITQTLQAASLFALAGRTTPPEAFHNVSLIWDAYRQVSFTAPPYAAPGGTMYVTGSDALYYPEGSSWGVDRRAHVMAVDAMVDSLDLAVTAAPTVWATLHADAALAMQERGSDGRTYQTGDDDTYAGREQWVAVHAAQAWLARYTHGV